MRPRDERPRTNRERFHDVKLETLREMQIRMQPLVRRELARLDELCHGPAAGRGR